MTDTTAQIERIVAENPSYRLVEPHDLVAGKELYMVGPNPTEMELQLPFQTIVLDDEPTGVRLGDVPYVYYHCHSPYWEGQCFVPTASFLGLDGDQSVRYWVKR